MSQTDEDQRGQHGARHSPGLVLCSKGRRRDKLGLAIWEGGG